MSPTILLVEDNSTDERLTVHALKKSGVRTEVVVVRDGAAALDYLFGTGAFVGRDPSVLPKVVLLDLNLPKLGGLEVLRRIRQDARTSSLPVVILTSSVEVEDIRQARSLGTNAYVQKVMAFARYTEAMRTVAVFWLEINEAAPSPSSTAPGQ